MCFIETTMLTFTSQDISLHGKHINSYYPPPMISRTDYINRPARHPVLMIVFLLIMGLMNVYGQNTVYVDPDAGSDNNLGLVGSPFRTIRRGLIAIPKGGIVYLRSGVYHFSGADRLILDSVGAADKRFRLWAFPGEHPILDFSGQTNANDIFKGGIELHGDFYHLKGIEERNNAYGNGCTVYGSNNTIENCTFHANGLNSGGSGIYVYGRPDIRSGTANNLILNCDAYDHFDKPTNGGNADGFDVAQAIGPGNSVKGCRAWNNADDGFDCWKATNPVLFDSCYAFANGYASGNGNGFKMGGGNPAPATSHIFRNCLAANNLTNGFDQNGNNGGLTLLNCTAYRNGQSNYNLSASPTTGAHLLVNCIDYQGVLRSTISTPNTQTTNSWQVFSVTRADFASIDSTGEAGRSRGVSGVLPPSVFLRLASGSRLRNAGTPTGLPFKGTAPDLGAFESDPTATGSNVLELSPTRLDFGSIPTNHVSLLPVQFINTWTDTLKGVSVSSPNPVFSATRSGFDLAPGASFTDSIRASAVTPAGQISAVIIVAVTKPNEVDTISVKAIVSSTSRTRDLDALPETFTLSQNYPNPFNPSTTIVFNLPETSPVLLDVSSMSGAHIRTLVQDVSCPPATYRVVWDGTNDQRCPVASGTYIYRMVAGSYRATGTMLLIH